MVEHLPSRHKVLGLIPRTTINKNCPIFCFPLKIIQFSLYLWVTDFCAQCAVRIQPPPLARGSPVVAALCWTFSLPTEWPYTCWKPSDHLGTGFFLDSQLCCCMYMTVPRTAPHISVMAAMRWVLKSGCVNLSMLVFSRLFWLLWDPLQFHANLRIHFTFLGGNPLKL